MKTFQVKTELGKQYLSASRYNFMHPDLIILISDRHIIFFLFCQIIFLSNIVSLTLNGMLCIYRSMKNRSRYEVIAAILKSAGRDETRTKIMYKAMLSNDQCKIYLDSLLDSGLIAGSNSGNKVVYKITQKGSKFLSYYDQMRLLLPVIVEENYEGNLYHSSI